MTTRNDAEFNAFRAEQEETLVSILAITGTVLALAAIFAGILTGAAFG